MIRRTILALLALIAFADHAYAEGSAWRGIRGVYGSAIEAPTSPCAYGTNLGDGCPAAVAASLSYSQPNFFSSYAIQSYNYSPAACLVTASCGGVQWTAAAGQAITSYYYRPNWNVAGVDYPVGLPVSAGVTPSSLHGSLKNPYNIASDPNITNCVFYANNAAAIAAGVTGAQNAGSGASPIPSPNGGPSIYCNGGSTAQIVFDGYDFGWWNDGTTDHYDCVEVYFKGNAWGTSAANTSKETANIVFRNSLFVNGPSCNIWGAFGSGASSGSITAILSGTTLTVRSGTAYPGVALTGSPTALPAGTHIVSGSGSTFTVNNSATVGSETMTMTPASSGPNAPNQTQLLYFASPPAYPVTANGIAFYNDTFIGCGGDPDQTPLENAECAATFSATSYSSGSTTMIANATVGVAPVGSRLANIGWGGNFWMVNNAILHLTGRGMNLNQSNSGNYTATIAGNYQEGLIYYGDLWAQISSVAYNSTDGTYYYYTINTVQPHGVPVGSYATGIIDANRSSLTAGLSGTFSLLSAGSNTLTMRLVTNPTAWTYSSGSYPVFSTSGDHGELMEWGFSTTGPSFTGSISGTALTLQSNASPASIAAGLPLTGSGIPAGVTIVSGSGQTTGSTWTISQSLGTIATEAMATPLYAQNTMTMNWTYNTQMQPKGAMAGGEAPLYMSGGSTNGGVPFITFAGTVDHNVFISNLTANLSHRSMSTAGASFDYSSYGSLNVSNNYFDPTGSYACWSQQQITGTGSNFTSSGNVNMTSATADANINTFDSYGLLTYVAGTAINTAASQGINYTAGGALSVVLGSATNPALSVGNTVFIGNTTPSQLFNGNFIVTGISGGNAAGAVVSLAGAQSTDSKTIATGSVTFNITSSYNAWTGKTVAISNGSNTMVGPITAVSLSNGSGTMTVNVTSTSGSGAFSAWNINPYGILQTTSASSLTVGTGAQSLTVGTGLSYSLGMTVTISNGSNSMTGVITSYTIGTGALAVNVLSTTGSGTVSSWTVQGQPTSVSPTLSLTTNTGSAPAISCANHN